MQLVDLIEMQSRNGIDQVPVSVWKYTVNTQSNIHNNKLSPYRWYSYQMALEACWWCDEQWLTELIIKFVASINLYRVITLLSFSSPESPSISKRGFDEKYKFSYSCFTFKSIFDILHNISAWNYWETSVHFRLAWIHYDISIGLLYCHGCQVVYITLNVCYVSLIKCFHKTQRDEKDILIK